MKASPARLLLAAVLIAFFLLIPRPLPSSAQSPQPTGTPTDSANPRQSLISPDRLVGNVDGTVRDARTLEPIPNAEVFLLEEPVQKRGVGEIIHTDRGEVVLPDVRRALMHGTTNQTGEFLINFVPVPVPSKTYTIVIRAPSYSYWIADSARVLPGAVMTLNVNALLEKDVHLLFEPSDQNAPLKYRHEMDTNFPIPGNKPEAPSSGDDRVGYTVLATREGLVGYSTANGHIILPRDHFVALPSRRVLNANDHTYDFQVRLAYAGKTVDAPVWDVGPWNIADDYWNPSSVRQMWQDLPQGMPEAQAAYQSGYNGGRDQFGRKVTVPTAVDLADGTFWDDLGLLSNAWISVKYLWKPNVTVGDRIYAAADLPVRATPAGNQVGLELCGGGGVIAGGPVGATFDLVYYVWWDIHWDNGAQGWSAENQLGKMPAGDSALPLSTLISWQPNGTNGYFYFFPLIGRQQSAIVCPN